MKLFKFMILIAFLITSSSFVMAQGKKDPSVDGSRPEKGDNTKTASHNNKWTIIGKPKLLRWSTLGVNEPTNPNDAFNKIAANAPNPMAMIANKGTLIAYDVYLVREGTITSNSNNFGVSKCQFTVNNVNGPKWYISNPENIISFWKAPGPSILLPVGSIINIEPQASTSTDKIEIYGYTFRKGNIKVTDEGFELQHGTEVILH